MHYLLLLLSFLCRLHAWAPNGGSNNVKDAANGTDPGLEMQSTR